jgi:hypothetical protein
MPREVVTLASKASVPSARGSIRVCQVEIAIKLTSRLPF